MFSRAMFVMCASVMFLVVVSPQCPTLRHFTPSDTLRTYENRPHIRSLNKLTPKRLRYDL